MKTIKLMGIAVIILGIVGLVIGAIFLGIGIAKNQLIVNRMNIEKVTLALDPDQPEVFTQIDNASEAQQAADTIAAHRRAIAPTYQDLLGGKRFDPTNMTQLTYVQAMNLENYLYMAVTAFGLIQIAEATGGFMILTGIALAFTGFALYRFSKVYQIEH
jgi:hypothetical protein